jgi:enoyl-CoA hydratase/carnithine racemase
MEFTDITYATDEGVALITLNRPDVLNAISARAGGTRDQIVAALGTAEADSSLGCVLVLGAGRSFCGGGDLTANVRREHSIDDLHFAERADSFHARLRNCALPTIAAVHGHCLGAGLLLAASCDLVVAARHARLGFPEGRLGLVGASVLVPVLGRQWAKFLMLTGELLTAAQARELGLVLSVEPDDELVARSLDLARRIARMPREGVELNRRAINTVADVAGEAAARQAALAHDSLTLSMAAHATAPDGRTFRSILEHEGMEGMKTARALQYADNWLHADPA